MATATSIITLIIVIYAITLVTLETSLLMSRLMMIGIGLLSFVGQILLTLSLQLEEAGKVVFIRITISGGPIDIVILILILCLKVSIMRKAGDILFAFLFQIFIFQVHRRRCVFSTFGFSIAPSTNSSLFPGLPWSLEHRWCHPCQCRSFHQWIKQGWEQSNMTAFIWCSSINLAFLNLQNC